MPELEGVLTISNRLAQVEAENKAMREAIARAIAFYDAQDGSLEEGEARVLDDLQAAISRNSASHKASTEPKETMTLVITRSPGAAFVLTPEHTHYGYAISREDGTCIFQGAGVKPKLDVHAEFERYIAQCVKAVMS